jgi:hypothetical protein
MPRGGARGRPLRPDPDDEAGPTPDIEPDGLRRTPENPPAPVPSPEPEVRPGPVVIWACAGQPAPSARLNMRTADLVLLVMLHMRLIPRPGVVRPAIAKGRTERKVRPGLRTGIHSPCDPETCLEIGPGSNAIPRTGPGSAENSLRIVKQNEFCQLQRVFDRPATTLNRLFVENIRQNPSIHVEFRRNEFELVGV